MANTAKSTATQTKQQALAVRDRLRAVATRGVAVARPFFASFWIFALIVGVIVAAQWTLFGKASVGIYINAAAFAALVGLGLRVERARQLAISAAIIPVATMASLSLPQTTNFAQTVVFYDALLVLALVYRFMFTLDHPLDSIRLTVRGYLIALPLMMVIGQALGVIGYGLLRHQYTFEHTSLPLVAATTAVFAITEEVLLRGLIQQRASLVFHPALAAVLSTVLFVAMSFGHTGSYLVPLFALILGSVLSATYYFKQNLVLTITMNLTAKLVYIGLMAGFIFR